MRGTIEEITHKANAFLKSESMNVNMDWLTGCVEFFCEENSSRSINDQEFNNMVKNQWMLGDLKDLCPGSLPSSLCKLVKTTLSDIYVLQMNAVFDVGTPAYQQLQKLNHIDITNIEATNIHNSEPSSQRMLKLILTDGIQEISGIEYKSMRNLSGDLMPGTKIKIKGPVDCRRGVLMLEEKHVMILGGEVEDLLEINSCKNVLSRRIGTADTTATGFTREPYCPSIAQNNSRNSPPILKNQNIPPAFINNCLSDTNLTGIYSNNQIDVFVDDDFDINQIDAIESEILNEYSHDEPCGYVTPQNVAKKMKVCSSTATINSQLFNPDPCSTNVTKINTNSNDYTSETEDFEQYYNDEMENMRDCEYEVQKSEINPEKTAPSLVKTSQHPYVYLKQLLQVSEEFCLDKTFVVKALILKQLSKLSVQNCVWVFKCIITDGSGILDVDISSDVLTQIIGYSPEETMAMKKQFNKNPALKGKLLEGIDRARQTLQTLDSILHIKFKPSGPCIVKISELTGYHLSQLKRRVQMIA